MNIEMDEYDITKFDEYNATEKKHGKLEEVANKDLLVLHNGLSNFDNMSYNIEPAKEIMYEHIKKKYSSYTIADFGCIKLAKDTLVLKLRDETLCDNSYLFNTKTGEVYFINELIMNHIPTSTFNNYNNVITNGIKRAQSIIDDISSVMSFKSDL